MEYISTTTLANECNLQTSDLFNLLKKLNWIDRINDKWVLTETGKKKGGIIKNHTKFGEFIAWPEDIEVPLDSSGTKSKLINATNIGKHFNISSQRLYLILSELGWIKKNLSGWESTKLGKSLGGKQFEHEVSGGTYVLWPDNIVNNKILITSLSETPTSTTETIPKSDNQNKNSNSDSFREKFPATFRTKDGHFVRSRAEVIIDNALYDYNLAHAYERKLPIEEDLYADFFIPSEGVYIEFWGLEDDPKYNERKKIKQEIYKKYDFKLIELNDNDISNLDDHLPKKLLKFGIKVY
ncbi:glycerol kinase [Leptospira meyeri]|uniref:glycerol kinase n=1 Tax=Leptospira meyeri TaxID=29508 RepID=UPI0010845EBA|nr:glycerol kinase [Leptospira meyeri]TGM62989.1 glycerol kinase [Leptospira meyeri]TGM68618.1 glycerol kinase [Leptospira meyeri]